ncbi:MAG TPA: hypothetical protein ENN76_03610 [Euryarchaeota archaeon]|nr:hypothetical protein [Euryarchaeota archaeon]
MENNRLRLERLRFWATRYKVSNRFALFEFKNRNMYALSDTIFYRAKIVKGEHDRLLVHYLKSINDIPLCPRHDLHDILFSSIRRNNPSVKKVIFGDGIMKYQDGVYIVKGPLARRLKNVLEIYDHIDDGIACYPNPHRIFNTTSKACNTKLPWQF